jgi:signal transduction histidine kinase/CheY-like chemotaxis protein
MLNMLGSASKDSPEFAESARELMQSTLRVLILTCVGLYTAWFLFVCAAWFPQQRGWNVWMVTPLFIATAAAALRLLSRHPLVAQAVWLSGLAVTITAALALFRAPSVALLYALLPLMAATLMSWHVGLGVVGMVAALAFVLAIGSDPLLDTTTAWAVAILAAVTGTLGWATTYSSALVTHWALTSFAQARRDTEAVRLHRAQLAQIHKSLDQAYYRLERANAALVAAYKAADEAERFKTEFVTNVSHELRTPLNLIVGFSEMIRNAPESYGAPLPGAYRSDINAIYHSAQHLLTLVDDVLDLARLDVGRIALTRDSVDLSMLISEALELVRDYIHAKGLALHVRIAPGLPLLTIDRLRIRQVLLNLVVNASRFTEQGSITVTVGLEERNGTDYARVAVSDTGRGIPPNALADVFQEFQTSEGAGATWHSGSGLGLPISKRFVELHGGDIGVTSTLGQGTTFWFTLPVRPPDEAPHAAFNYRPPLPIAQRTDRVVVVVHEDDATVSLLQRYLDGYLVQGARTAAEGAALARESRAIALIGAMGDVEALPAGCLHIRCRITSRRDAAHALGANDLLVKPVAQHELTAALARLPRPVEQVLIVEDNPEMTRLLRRFLRAVPGISRIDEAGDGCEALAVARERPPDAILLDLSMPNADGLAVLAALHEDARLADVQVIVVSAKAQEYLRVQMTDQVTIARAGGFALGDMVRLIDASLTNLNRGWHQT